MSAELRGAAADVALLLEGTYPFVRGGVSAWVHHLIEALPEMKFSVVLLGGRRSDHAAPAYAMPGNVVHFERHYLFEPEERKGPADESFLDTAMLQPLEHGFAGAEAFTRESFLHGDRSWQRICERYREECPETSFLNYFWTLRATRLPLFATMEIVARLPPARYYHSLSTGYAGLLGALLRRRHGRPLILTEHGIYTKERMIDLASADSFPGDEEEGSGVGRQLWMELFQGLGKIAYSAADPIIALYDGNRRRQIDDGADAARTRVIPNGVEVNRFRPLRTMRPPRPPPVIGFIGRVVPIKDVKTFIRSMKAIVAERPEVEGWIVGPTSEDEAYAAECGQLVSSLGLQGSIKFLGFRRPEEILPQLGLLVLTSISEALPLVVLEAFASGLPVVTTDVGACRELVEGTTPQDRALGTAGAVVPIADPQATARATLALLRDPWRWRAAQKAAIRRVEAHYTEAQTIEAYRQVYREAGTWRA